MQIVCFGLEGVAACADARLLATAVLLLYGAAWGLVAGGLAAYLVMRRRY